MRYWPTKTYPGCQRFSGRRAAKIKARRERKGENLWLAAAVDWSYRANRFELGSRSDTASWLEEPYSRLVTDRCVVIGCLLINVMMLIIIDTYHSMIMRFALSATRGFLSPLLSLSHLVSSWRKKTSGTRVPRTVMLGKTTPFDSPLRIQENSQGKSGRPAEGQQ